MIEYDSKEYNNALSRLGSPADKPFKIERICAELAWISPKQCPLYPFSKQNDLFETEEDCKFLTDDEYPNYRCPNMGISFAEVIAKKGSQEEKKALEHLADMFLRYGSMKNPPAEPGDERLEEALEIYKLLRLEEKTEKTKVKIVERNKIIYQQRHIVLVTNF